MPGSTSAIRAGSAFVELFTKDAALQRGLRRARQKLKAFGATVTGIGTRLTALGGVALAPLIASVFEFAKSGDALDKMSARTGIAVEALSELSFAAQQTGQSQEQLEAVVIGMTRQVRNLERGLSTATEAFGALGLTYADLKGLSPEEQFTLIADRLSKIEDPTRRAGIAMEVFGRSGRNLIPLLSLGAKGIEALRKEARRLGIVITGPEAKAAAEFTDAWNRVRLQLLKMVIVIGGQLAPALTNLAGILKTILKPVIEWIKQNPQLTQTIAAVTVGVIALGAALIAFGLVAQGAAAIAGVLATALGIVGAIINALLSPVGLVALAIAGLTVAFFKFTDVGQSAFAAAASEIKQRLGEIAETVTSTWAGIMKAMLAGRFDLAAKAAWLGVQVVWLEAKDWLLDNTDAIWKAILVTAVEFGTKLQKAFGTVGDALSLIWIEITSRLQMAFVKVAEFLHTFVAGRLGTLIAKIGAAVEKIPGAADIGSKLKGAGELLKGLGVEAAGAGKLVKQDRERRIEAVGDRKRLRDEALDKSKDFIKQAIEIQFGIRGGMRDAEVEAKREELRALLAQINQLQIDRDKTKKTREKDTEKRVEALGGSLGTFSAAVVNRTAFTSQKELDQKRLLERQVRHLENIEEQLRNRFAVFK